MLEVDRAGATVTFTTPEPLEGAALVHPYLAPAAAVAGSDRGARERWRVDTGFPAPETPVKGFVTLSWGDELAIERPGPAERAALLLRHLALVQRRPDVEVILDLSALPLLRLVRSGDLRRLAAGADRLFGELAALPE